MAYRKIPLSGEYLYHIYTKSIAEYTIFRSEYDYNRFIDIMNFYTAENPPCKFSDYVELFDKTKKSADQILRSSKKLVRIVCYCIMPTHLHLVLEQLLPEGISKYIKLVLLSYSRYFNTKYERLGPLFQGRFKNVLVAKDEQLLHLTRYIHLNPVSAYLSKKPEEWKYSSYSEYLNKETGNKICDYSNCLQIKQEDYQNFVNENIDNQRELQKIKHLTLE